MADAEFLKQFKDLSVESGNTTGFQFGFTCPSCNKSLKSEFVPRATGGTWVKAGMFKKEDPSEMSEARVIWNKAKMETLTEFADEIEREYTFCGKCCLFVCLPCYQGARTSCMKCISKAAQIAIESGLRQQSEELAKEREAKCPSCNALVGGAKFCPKCGMKMIVRGICPHCNAKISKEATFCTECGKKVTAT